MSILNRRYRIIHPLGKGGMGVVYKATDALLGHRFVALKEMDLRGVDAQDIANAITACRREALILAGLTHPNLPRIYDYFEENGKAYLVMDFIEGETLADLLHHTPDKRLGAEEVLSIAEQLCSVLAYLHARRPPIIFRDMKPVNIMMTYKERHLYLIDFGIARFFKPRQARDTRFLGTAGYAAPEQYLAQTSASSDIYSLGVTLHELLTGLSPAQGKAPAHFPAIREYNPHVPFSLETLIRQMLDPLPSKRPATVAAIKQQLQQIRLQWQSEPRGSAAASPAPLMRITTKMPALVWPSITRPITRSRQGAPICIYQKHTDSVYAVAWSPDGRYVVSGSKDRTAQIWNASTGERTLVYAGHTREVYSVAWSPPPFDDRIASTSVGAVHIWSAIKGNCFLQYGEHHSSVYATAWSPSSFAMASGGEDRKVSLWGTNAGEVLRWYPDFPGAVRTVAWSNHTNAIRLLIGCEDALLYCWETTTQGLSLVYRGHKGAVACVAWSPDGQKCVSASTDRTVKIWDVSTGHTLYTYQGHAGEVYTVAWSPDGTRIASAGRDRVVHVWEAATGKMLYTYQGHTGGVYTVAWSPDSTCLASAGEDQTVHIWRQTAA
jgi:WD40 repeat protein/predicted Ser/Thr protein kinase